MTYYTGLDIGGTKIAGAVYDEDGTRHEEVVVLTPDNYEDFLSACESVVTKLQEACGGEMHVGICCPGAIDHERGTAAVANIPYLNDHTFAADLGMRLGREIRIANDANCIALAEAVDGAGKGFRSVLGITLSTGVGAGFAVDGKVIDGPNGLTGEIGHIPLPFREEEDGPLVPCFCGQLGCIEKSICGGGLARLYAQMTGNEAEPFEIAKMARTGDKEALAVLDRFYEVVAKAMVVILHSFDPHIIVVSGGLHALPGLYEEVPKRWQKYCVVKNVKTKFVQAKHGPAAGLRGAAWLWR